MVSKIRYGGSVPKVTTMSGRRGYKLEPEINKDKLAQNAA
jgi:hypothetical protein